MWILRGPEALEIHTCSLECMSFILDLQRIVEIKVKSGRGLGCTSCRYAMQAAMSGAFNRRVSTAGVFLRIIKFFS